MPYFPRAMWLAGFVSLALEATPAPAAFVESQVRAYSADDHEPLLQPNNDCDPLPPQDTEEPDDVDCSCDVFGGGFEPDEKCIDGDLFRFTSAQGIRVFADSFACDVDFCAFPGDPPAHGLGIAESNFGLSFVDVFSSWKVPTPTDRSRRGEEANWTRVERRRGSILEARDATLRIPTEAVLEGNQCAGLRPASSTLSERSIKPGLANWQYTEILEGVQEHEQVVTSVQREGVKAGAKVTLEQSPS